jgi:hypothetical protein
VVAAATAAVRCGVNAPGSAQHPTTQAANRQTHHAGHQRFMADTTKCAAK